MGQIPVKCSAAICVLQLSRAQSNGFFCFQRPSVPWSKQTRREVRSSSISIWFGMVVTGGRLFLLAYMGVVGSNEPPVGRVMSGLENWILKFDVEGWILRFDLEG